MGQICPNRSPPVTRPVTMFSVFQALHARIQKEKLIRFSTVQQTIFKLRRDQILFDYYLVKGGKGKCSRNNQGYVINQTSENCLFL